MSEEIGTTITPAPNGPLIVKGLNNFRNSKGPLEAKATIALCRCGQSGTKPFCDGAHAKVGFTSEKVEGRVLDRKDRLCGCSVGPPKLLATQPIVGDKVKPAVENREEAFSIFRRIC